MCGWLSPFLSLRSVCTGPKGEMARSEALAPAGPAQGGVVGHLSGDRRAWAPCSPGAVPTPHVMRKQTICVPRGAAPTPRLTRSWKSVRRHGAPPLRFGLKVLKQKSTRVSPGRLFGAVEQSLPEVWVPGSRLTPCSPSSPCWSFPKHSFSTDFAQCQGPSLMEGETRRDVRMDSRWEHVSSFGRGGSSGRWFPSRAWWGSLPPPDSCHGFATVLFQSPCRVLYLHGPREDSQPAHCLGRPQLRDSSEAQAPRSV